MQEEKLSYRTAKLAHEKGYKNHLPDYPEYYDEDGEIQTWVNNSEETFDRKDYVWVNTQASYQRHLREKHQIHVNPIPNFRYGMGRYHVGIVFMNLDCKVDTVILRETKQKISPNNPILYDSFEEALESGLYYATENLIVNTLK